MKSITHFSMSIAEIARQSVAAPDRGSAGAPQRQVSLTVMCKG